MKMQAVQTIIIYIWWLLLNSFIHYCELNFLICITQKRDYKYMPLWIIMNIFITSIIIFWGLSGMLLPHILLLAVYSIVFMKIPWLDIVAPITIIFTLYTFLEGFSAVIMYWAASNITSYLVGKWIQTILTVILYFLFFISLRYIKKKYVITVQQKILSYLYILLLPCAFIVLIIRYGLQLDSIKIQDYFLRLGVNASLSALVLMLGEVIIFFIMIEVFCKILTLTGQETERILLADQLDKQSIYIEEAKNRNEHYRSFQHDIDNHLLVLSGLIHKDKYEEAELYLSKLQVYSAALPDFDSTGNVVLDILLKEKSNYAKQNNIRVNCNVRIPEAFFADSMDLCIVFSNILDNAIQACMNEKINKPTITINTKVRYQFLVIEAINTVAGNGPVIAGTGLMNVANIAKKYKGTLHTENNGCIFRISVMLCSGCGD